MTHNIEHDEPKGELILYQTEDGQAEINLRSIDGTVWLTQAELGELFDTTPQNVTLHIKSIYEDGELAEEATCKDFLQVRTEGVRTVERRIKHYNLDVILAVGYRVRSPRGVQFRRWANTVLKEYLIKGFAMDDARLKQAEQWDYFDEWLARIRDIRASEKRFYQKVKDLYTTAVDYDKDSDEAQLFFQKVQNKMLWAITGQTAAELIAGRADPDKPNMGVMSWKGSIVRKGDVGIAKNYLNSEEIDELNRIVTMYLDYAEDQAKRRAPVTMSQWADKLDSFLSFNERDVLTHAGKLQMKVAQKLAADRYEAFDLKRKEAEALAADAEDIEALENLAKDLEGKKGGGE
ncbi:virulence RhuM family protein [Brucella gallinifaecis]|uniref:Virulence RhuM family protein n=1 Tax=Brucella gallinifaecis TaxID=215590 RepID=A0A502BIG8_9HYPH|nr:virulence RhuM family protein [Brucella gallinifaecis]TPF74050.1 virulence RhuM family protein [Brucella gallinifaecis]